ncbi:hypothetical protein K490DRAFT_61898 [Saccharata proteae CBS 121410]|uniref:Uncharacterized protein n=1 Tax=Saccharata proteae CBS 121410 TaxID=1314787 RepID=A0A9P4I005_9PEZI|nr:hypothetical protein K490DRAFT_61898 [Saccharata proteae CBS 121410]
MDSETVNPSSSMAKTTEESAPEHRSKNTGDMNKQDHKAYVKYFGSRQSYAINSPQGVQRDDREIQRLPPARSCGRSYASCSNKMIHILSCGHSVKTSAAEECAYNCDWVDNKGRSGANGPEISGNFLCIACFNHWSRLYSGVFWNKLNRAPRSSNKEQNSWIDEIDNIQEYTRARVEELHNYLLQIMRFSKPVNHSDGEGRPRPAGRTLQRSFSPTDSALGKLARSEAAMMGTLQEAILNFAFSRVSLAGRNMADVMREVLDYSAWP